MFVSDDAMTSSWTSLNFWFKLHFVSSIGHSFMLPHTFTNFSFVCLLCFLPPKIVNDASVIHIFCVTCQLIFRCDKECTNGAHFWANSPLIFVCRASDKNTQKKRQPTEKKSVKKILRKKLFLLLRRAYLGMKGYYLPMALWLERCCRLGSIPRSPGLGHVGLIV